eukprot:4396434-Prymnesium_polylepis.1
MVASRNGGEGLELNASQHSKDGGRVLTPARLETRRGRLKMWERLKVTKLGVHAARTRHTFARESTEDLCIPSRPPYPLGHARLTLSLRPLSRHPKTDTAPQHNKQ